MTVTETPANPITRCGACGQEDDHPKHQILVGINNQHTKGEIFHPDDEDKDGVIQYHFDCPTEWHDLASALATRPIPAVSEDQPWTEWKQESADEHLAVATRHQAIVLKAQSGIHGEELRAWIQEVHEVQQPGEDPSGAQMMAGGIDQTMANAILDGLTPNSGTATVGAKTLTGPHHARLMTANGSDTAAGTELGTSGGYTAGGSALAFASAASGSKATNAAVSWTNMPTTTLTGVEEWDTSATPLRTFWGPWTGGNISVTSGNTFTIASGSLTNALA